VATDFPAVRGDGFFEPPPGGKRKMAPPPFLRGAKWGQKEGGGAPFFSTSWAAGLSLAQAQGPGLGPGQAKAEGNAQAQAEGMQSYKDPSRQSL